MFEKINNPEGKENARKYVFEVEKSDLPYVFYYLQESIPIKRIIYSFIHFDGEVFRHPENKEEVTTSDFLNFLRDKFKPDKIILSCCYPGKAKKIVGEQSDVEFLGPETESDNCEVSTRYNSIEQKITVEFRYEI